MSPAADPLHPETAEAEAGQLARDLATLKADVARLTDTLSALVQQQGTLAKAAMREGVRSAQQGAEDAVAQAYEAGRLAVDRARDEVLGLSGDATRMIEKNPVQSVLIALGVGFLIGAMSRGRG